MWKPCGLRNAPPASKAVWGHYQRSMWIPLGQSWACFSLRTLLNLVQLAQTNLVLNYFINVCKIHAEIDLFTSTHCFFFSNGKETKGCSLNEIWIQIIWSHFREIAYFSILCKPYHIVRLESIGLKDLLYYNHPFYINSRHPHSQPHYATHNNILAILFEKYFLQHQGSHNHRSKCLLKVLKKILHKGYIKNNIKFDSQRQKFYLFFWPYKRNLLLCTPPNPSLDHDTLMNEQLKLNLY